MTNNETKRFTSKRGTTYVLVSKNLLTGKLSVGVYVDRLCWVDWPIRYDDGSIAYDAPYKIPKYARRLVAKAYQWIDKQ